MEGRGHHNAIDMNWVGGIIMVLRLAMDWMETP
jgi:hypothetical protein